MGGSEYAFLAGKTVLVTGGTGSFGQKFVETVLRNARLRALRIYSRDELKQHEMRQRFPESPESPVRYLIGDVRDENRLRRALDGVDIVVHSAALKQVPACEYNPIEAVKTNILGAANLIDAAVDCGVKKVIALSTDKAVNPINLYGATKLCAEKLFIHGNAYAGHGEPVFSCARYGNVVASRGSVIPLFLQQRVNGTVTVTDARMTRFWITLEEGVRFVLRALELMQGGEVFVPKIPSMRMMDLVSAIAPGARVEFTGIRPGEKLHELLVSPDEAYYTLEYADMFVIHPPHLMSEAARELAQARGGKALSEGFRYGSDTAPHQLTIEELQAMVKELEIDTMKSDERYERLVA